MKPIKRFIEFTLILFITLNLLAVTKPSYGLTVDRVLATVGNEIITLSDYQQFVKTMWKTANEDVVDETLLKQLIEERIILQEAERKGIEASDTEVNSRIEEFKDQNGLSSEDLEMFLREEDMSMNSYRELIKEKIILSKLINEDVDSKVVIMDREIKEFYNTHRKNYLSSPEKVEIKAIFLRLQEDPSVTEITDLKRKALRIAARLSDGDSFEKLVDECSDEPLKSQGGMLGKFIRGTLVLPLEEKAYSMKKGEISEPIWVSDGVYILKLINKGDEIFKSVDEVKGEISNILYMQKREKLFNEWIKTLWERASVIIKQG